VGLFDRLAAGRVGAGRASRSRSGGIQAKKRTHRLSLSEEPVIIIRVEHIHQFEVDVVFVFEVPFGVFEIIDIVILGAVRIA
jgi:hypothetical protein